MAIRRQVFLACLSVAALLSIERGAAAESKEACLQRWLVAERAQIVYGISKARLPWALIVDEDVWAQIPYGTKIAMIETMQCIIAGPDMFINLDARGHRSNKVLGEWRWGRLEVK